MDRVYKAVPKCLGLALCCKYDKINCQRVSEGLDFFLNKTVELLQDKTLSSPFEEDFAAIKMALNAIHIMKKTDKSFTDKWSGQLMDLVEDLFKRMQVDDMDACLAMLEMIAVELPFVPVEQAQRYFEIEQEGLEYIAGFIERLDEQMKKTGSTEPYVPGHITAVLYTMRETVVRMNLEFLVLTDPEVKDAVQREDQGEKMYQEYDKPWWPFRIHDSRRQWNHGSNFRQRFFSRGWRVYPLIHNQNFIDPKENYESLHEYMKLSQELRSKMLGPIAKPMDARITRMNKVLSQQLRAMRSASDGTGNVRKSKQF